jgi:phosphatidylglycerophosphate synthase
LRLQHLAVQAAIRGGRRRCLALCGEAATARQAVVLRTYAATSSPAPPSHSSSPPPAPPWQRRRPRLEGNSVLALVRKQQQQQEGGYHHHQQAYARLLRHLHTPPTPAKPATPIKEENEEGITGTNAASSTPSRPPSSRETYWTVPNIITLARIASSPLLAALILQGKYAYAVGGLAVAAGSDWLDGHIAKNYNQSSVLGSFLDPFADKVLVTALAVPLAMQGFLPMPLVVVVVGRDALLIGGSFVMRVRNRPTGAPFFDTTSSATFQITPNLLSKVNTTLQFGVLTFALSRALWGDAIPVGLDDLFEPLW